MSAQTSNLLRFDGHLSRSHLCVHPHINHIQFHTHYLSTFVPVFAGSFESLQLLEAGFKDFQSFEQLRKGRKGEEGQVANG